MQTETMAKELKTHEILLLENLRFYAAEEHPELDKSFAHKLSQLGDVYINDAFATAHRKHSSTATIAEYFPQRSVMGLLMQKEIDALSYLLKNPIRPFAAIVGGAKISTKIGVLHSLAMKADQLFIGGGMTYTFMKAKGLSIGSSIYDETSLEYAESFIRLCKDRSIPFHLPEDLVIRHTESGDIQIIDLDKGIPENWEGMDIGPKTCSAWEKLLSQAKTIFWNGPLGVFEIKPFEDGTKAIAEAIAKLDLVKSFIGGGDSIAVIEQLQLNKKFTHLSTGGGASLEYIEYGTLPGIEALSDKKS